jgi:hypothetical protein
MRYFAKELPQTAVWFSDGTQAVFSIANENIGLIAIDETAGPVEAKHVEELTNLAAKHVGGVIVIDEDRYVALKKKLESTPSIQCLRQPGPRLIKQSLSGFESAQPVAEVESPSAAPVEPAVPAEVKEKSEPAPPFVPRTGKVKPAG